MYRSAVIVRNLEGKLKVPEIYLRREFASKETAKRIAQDAGRIAQDSSKILVRIFEELSTCNEVKLVRLSTIRAYAACQVLVDKHVMKNPKFQSLLTALKQKLDGISKVAEAKKALISKRSEKGDAKYLVSKKESDTRAKSENEKQAKSQEVKH